MAAPASNTGRYILPHLRSGFVPFEPRAIKGKLEELFIRYNIPKPTEMIDQPLLTFQLNQTQSVDELIDSTKDHLRQFNGIHLSSFFTTLANFHEEVPPAKIEFMVDFFLIKFNCCDARQLVNIAWACSELGVSDKNVFSAIELELVDGEKMRDMQPLEFGQYIEARCKAGFTQNDNLRKMIVYVCHHRIEQFSFRALVNFAHPLIQRRLGSYRLYDLVTMQAVKLLQNPDSDSPPLLIELDAIINIHSQSCRIFDLHKSTALIDACFLYLQTQQRTGCRLKDCSSRILVSLLRICKAFRYANARNIGQAITQFHSILDQAAFYDLSLGAIHISHFLPEDKEIMRDIYKRAIELLRVDKPNRRDLDQLISAFRAVLQDEIDLKPFTKLVSGRI